jgi:hypothetical protein
MRTISRHWSFCFVVAFSLLLVVGGRFTYAQGRVNDKDMENLMKNLRDDAKSFRGTFDSAIKKSTIRKTSREKDAKNLVAQFEKQTDAMLKNFKRTKKGDTDIRVVMDSAAQIDSLLRSVVLGGQTSSKWAKIQIEIHQVSSGFGIDSQYNPAGAYRRKGGNQPGMRAA